MLVDNLVTSLGVIWPWIFHVLKNLTYNIHEVKKKSWLSLISKPWFTSLRSLTVKSGQKITEFQTSAISMLVVALATGEAIIFPYVFPASLLPPVCCQTCRHLLCKLPDHHHHPVEAQWEWRPGVQRLRPLLQTAQCK